MPIPSNPSYLLDVIGSQADVFSIPETTPEGSGALSYASGWPKIVATALSAGGLPPQREYFNAVNKLLSQHIFFLQSGGVYPWNSALDYNPGARVMGSNGIVYVAVAASGPDVSEVGAQNPTTDSANTYWQTLAASLMSSSGGLVVDPETGQASVDFSQMPTDKFEALLQSIRVPIWLTQSTAFYVNPTTGVDNQDEGRGLSASLPFKTLPYTIKYITDNFNLSSYSVTVWLAHGLYTESSTSYNSPIVTLGGFSGQGTITIRGESPENASSTILNYLFVLTQASNWAFQDVTIAPTITATRGPGVNVLDVSKGQVDLYNAFLDCLYIENNSAGNARNFLYARGYGYIRVYATNDLSIPSGITFNFRDKQLDLNPLAASTGTLQFTADINIAGGGGVTTFCQMSLLAMCSFSLSSFVNPGRAPQINLAEGVQVTGKRYSINNNSIVTTGGKGPDFFPGDTEGTTATGAQYS